MLKFLLDEHVSSDVAEGLRRQAKGIVAHALSEWNEGQLLGADDEVILQEAAAKKLTLVTYDLRTIPPLLKRWADVGRDHGGVIFVDGKTIPSWDIGGLVRALLKLHQESVKWDWRNRACFLRRRIT